MAMETRCPRLPKDASHGHRARARRGFGRSFRGETRRGGEDGGRLKPGVSLPQGEIHGEIHGK